MNINVKTPDGNVFVILGRFKNLVDQLEKAGCDVIEHRKLLSEYRSLKYDDILNRIEQITNGTMTFTGRKS